MLNISTAIHYLTRGCRARRQEWKLEGCIEMALQPKKHFVWIINGQKTGTPVMLQVEDLEANDWEIIPSI